MAKTKPRVGVDLGATAVRVVLVNGVNKESLAEVTKVGIAPVTPGAIAGGRVKDPAQVAMALTQALNMAKVPKYGPVFGMASPDAVLVATEMAAAIKPKEWEATLRLSGRSLSPKLPMNATALSLYETPQDEVGKVSLLAAGILFSEVDSVVETCQLAKVTPRALDLAPIATMRCLTRVQPGSTDRVTVVDIGASKTSVVTRHGMFVRSIRTLETGGDDVTRAIMGATGLDFVDAERRKMSLSMLSGGSSSKTEEMEGYGGVKQTQVSDLSQAADDLAAQAVRAAGDVLVDQIAQAVEADTDKFYEYPTQGIVLAGGGCLLQGLRDAVAERVGVQAVIGRPWAQIKASGWDSEDTSLAFSLTTAIGTGMWE